MKRYASGFGFEQGFSQGKRARLGLAAAGVVALKPRRRRARLARNVGSLLQANLGFFVLTVAGADLAYDAAVTVSSVMNIVQGDTVVNRDGDHIVVKSIVVRGIVEATAAQVATTCRIMLIRDTNSAGALPTLANILDSGAVNAATQANILTTNRERFKVIRDIIITSDDSGDIASVPFKIYYKPPPIRSSYLDNSGTATAFGQNQYYLVYFGNTASAAANPGINFTSRVCFAK